MSRSERSNQWHDRRTQPRPSSRVGRKLADAAEHDITDNFDPWPLVAGRLARARRGGDGRSWTTPALDVAARRRARSVLSEAEERVAPSPDDDFIVLDLPVRRRTWPKEAAKLVATALIFFLFGLLLALLLRDNRQPQTAAPGDATPAVSATVGSVPTPTALVPSEPDAVFEIEGELLGVADGAGSLWIPDQRSGELLRVDPSSGAVLARIAIQPGGVPSGNITTGLLMYAVATDDGVWVTRHLQSESQSTLDGAVVRIDPATNTIAATIELEVDPVRLTVGEDAVWLYSAVDNAVVWIDRSTNAVVARIDIQSPTAILATRDAVWVTSQLDATTGVGTLTRIDPASNAIVALIPVEAPRALAEAGGAVWVAQLNSLARVDPATNSIVATHQVHAASLAGDQDELWLLGDGTVRRLDPPTGDIVDIRNVETTVAAMTIDDEAIWVLDRSAGRLLRIDR